MTTAGSLFRTFAAAIGAAGLVATTVQNIADVHRLLDEYFWWVLASAFILSGAALWPAPDRRRIGFAEAPEHRGGGSTLRPYRWVVVLTLTALFLGGWRLWEQQRRLPPTTSIHPTVPLGEGEEGRARRQVGGSHSAEPASGSRIHLATFGLDELKTSYVASREVAPFSSDEIGPDGNLVDVDLVLPTYHLPILDAETMAAAESEFFDWFNEEADIAASEAARPTLYEHQLSVALRARCASVVDLDTTRRALARFAAEHGRRRVLFYIETDELLGTLPTRRRDIVRRLLPKRAEWDDLRRDRASDYDAILKWLRECVGIPFPVFTVVLENASDRPLLVTGVDYHVIDAWRVLAAEPAPSALEPTFTYVHRIEPLPYTTPIELWLPYRATDPQVARYVASGRRFSVDDDERVGGKAPPPLHYVFNRPFSISAGSFGSFNLQLYLDGARDADTAHELLMSMELHTTLGSLRTSEFVLVAVPLGTG